MSMHWQLCVWGMCVCCVCAFAVGTEGDGSRRSQVGGWQLIGTNLFAQVKLHYPIQPTKKKECGLCHSVIPTCLHARMHTYTQLPMHTHIHSYPCNTQRQMHTNTWVHIFPAREWSIEVQVSARCGWVAQDDCEAYSTFKHRAAHSAFPTTQKGDWKPVPRCPCLTQHGKMLISSM